MVVNALSHLPEHYLGRDSDPGAPAAPLGCCGRQAFADDVATSIGVLAGVAVVVVTGIEILDPAIAVVVALYILWRGWGVLARSMSSLLNEAAPVAQLRRIRKVIGQHRRCHRDARSAHVPLRPHHLHRVASCRAR
jgi:divalent metal cation (Fe/Co/Zn/Cd) transporter